ncbi:MAG: hypothetical protein HY747_04845, partial [Elusimicrobia bacterium]|nr:hypothetical protein [Elusimicrobiota bacterium]
RATVTPGGFGAYFTIDEQADGSPLPEPSTKSIRFQVDPSTAVKLQVLVPGLAGDPGSLGGYAGTASTQTAGAGFNVTVRAVDNFWNLVAGETRKVFVETTDPYDVHPATVSLFDGATVFMTAMVSESTWTLIAKDTFTAGGFISASTKVYVGPADPYQFFITLPGETLEQGKCDVAGKCEIIVGTAGKTGFADFDLSQDGVQPATASVSGGDANGNWDFAANVYLTDRFMNRVRSHPATVARLRSLSDPYDTEEGANEPLPSNPQNIIQGLAVFNLSLRTAATGHWLTVEEEATSNGYLAGNSSTFTVTANEAKSLVVVLPNETLVNGKNTAPLGRSTATASVFISTVGGCYSAAVYTTDSYYNWVPNVNNSIITLTTPNDSFDVNPGAFTVMGGSAAVTGICPRRARNTDDILVQDAKLLAQDLDEVEPYLSCVGGCYSSNFTVKPGPASRLQALAPTGEETPNPASTAGKTGGPAAKISGTPFNIRARVTDAYWNLVETSPGIRVRIRTSDPNDVEPATKTVTVSDVFSLTLKRAATDHVISIYDEDNNPGIEDSDTGSSAIQNYTKIRPLTVNAGAADRIILIHYPDQTINQGATSYATARSGPVGPKTAGALFSVRVYLTDVNFNVVKNDRDGNIITVTAPGDPYAASQNYSAAIDATQGYALVSGIELRRAGPSQYLEAVIAPATLPGYNADSMAAGTNPSTFTVTAGTAQGLQILMPWETANPGYGSYPSGGKITGSTSTIDAPSLFAGAPFTVRANVVDQYFNTVGNNSVNGPCPDVYLKTSDSYDIEPATIVFNADGTRDLTVALVTRKNGHTIFASNPGLSGVLLANSEENSVNKTGGFFVESSAPARLLVILPGESEVEGRCDTAGVCLGSAQPGKSGSPGTFTIGASTQVRVHLVDSYYNRVRLPAYQPQVKVETPNDLLDLAETLPAQTMSDGQAFFNVSPRTAQSGYLVGSTTTATPVNLSSGISSGWIIYPGNLHHLHFDTDTNPASTGTAGPVGVWTPVTTAGENLTVRLTVHDAYHNVLSTGPNLYRGSATLTAEQFANDLQNPEFPCCEDINGDGQPDIVFTVSDKGSRYVSNLARLKKATTASAKRWIKAVDWTNEAAHSELAGYSSRPQITVNAAAPNAVQVVVDETAGGTSIVSPQGHTSMVYSDGPDIEIGAGNIASPDSSFGRAKVTGQVIDQFLNEVPQAGTTIYIEVVDISSQPSSQGGEIRFEAGVNVFAGSGRSTTTVSNATGQIGVSTPAWYFVYRTAGDSARVWMGTMTAPSDLADYVDKGINISKKFTTIGGNPSKFVFTAAPGVPVEADAAANYTVERRDDFNNPTTNGVTTVNLSLLSSDEAIHTANGFTKAASGNPPGKVFGFRDEGNNNFIASVVIPLYQISRNFIYRGQMSSLPAGEDNRTGTWAVQAKQSAILTATHNLTIKPKPAAK